MGSLGSNKLRGFTRAGPGVVGFIPVRVGSLEGDLWSSSSVAFAWVHSGEPRGSFGFALVQLGATRCRRVHSVLRMFTRARIGVVEFIKARVDSLGRA